MKNPDQALFRAVFSDPRQAGPLLQNAVPAELTRAIEWETLAPAPAAIAAGLSELLFTATWDGPGGLVYILLTLRSDAGMGPVLAVQGAIMRVSRRIMELHADAVEPPSVLPVVILQGRRPWKAGRSVRERSRLGS